VKILLITSHFYKAEGSIAKGIAATLTNHEVYFFSTAEIKYRRLEFEYLLNHVDVVHWLFNVAHLRGHKLRSYFENGKSPKVASVHHVCPEEQEKITVAANADIIHVVSHEWQDFVAAHTQTKVITAHLGIYPEDFRLIQSPPYVSGPFKIGMMGFYPGGYNRKRPDVAIEVFKELKRRYFDFEVVLQGGGWEKYLPTLLEQDIAFRQSDEKSGDEILKFFERVNLYLCTSDFEGGPLPVLESLQSSVPVVSTNIGIARDALLQGGGILAPKADVDALCTAIQKIQSDSTLYNQFRGEAKAVAQNFHWASVISEYEELYSQTIVAWEHKNKRVWQLAENELNAANQREAALAYDKIGQGITSMYKMNKKKGIQLLRSALLNKYISSSRKMDTLKKVLGYVVLNRKN
jgi:glycosyltransferase involved in cell wall biosynthesis